jgi:hypothetical protein
MTSGWVIYKSHPEVWTPFKTMDMGFNVIHTRSCPWNKPSKELRKSRLSPKAPRISNQKISNAGVRYPGEARSSIVI